MQEEISGTTCVRMPRDGGALESSHFAGLVGLQGGFGLAVEIVVMSKFDKVVAAIFMMSCLIGIVSLRSYVENQPMHPVSRIGIMIWFVTTQICGIYAAVNLIKLIRRSKRK